MATNTVLAQASDIEAYFIGLKFASSTRPSLAQVEYWLSLASSLVYSALNDKYTLPITNKVDLFQLKSLVVTYVLAEVNFVLGKSSTNVVAQGGQQKTTGISHKDFYALLDDYMNDKIVLLNTPPKSTWIMGQSYNAEVVRSGAKTTAFVSVKDDTQW